MQSWLVADVHAHDTSGGVPRVAVPGNLKAGVTKACEDPNFWSLFG